MVSLDKALELNQVSARVGDNIEIKCDVTGSPTPPIVWRRHGLDLAQLAEEELKVFPDGALYINNVRLIHAGNYTCHAQRNKDVVQTHVLHVHSMSISYPPFILISNRIEIVFRSVLNFVSDQISDASRARYCVPLTRPVRQTAIEWHFLAFPRHARCRSYRQDRS